jgi:hypothetical protein
MLEGIEKFQLRFVDPVRKGHVGQEGHLGFLLDAGLRQS